MQPRRRESTGSRGSVDRSISSPASASVDFRTPTQSNFAPKVQEEYVFPQSPEVAFLATTARGGEYAIALPPALSTAHASSPDAPSHQLSRKPSGRTDASEMPTPRRKHSQVSFVQSEHSPAALPPSRARSDASPEASPPGPRRQVRRHRLQKAVSKVHTQVKKDKAQAMYNALVSFTEALRDKLHMTEEKMLCAPPAESAALQEECNELAAQVTRHELRCAAAQDALSKMLVEEDVSNNSSPADHRGRTSGAGREETSQGSGADTPRRCSGGAQQLPPSPRRNSGTPKAVRAVSSPRDSQLTEDGASPPRRRSTTTPKPAPLESALRRTPQQMDLSKRTSKVASPASDSFGGTKISSPNSGSIDGPSSGGRRPRRMTNTARSPKPKGVLSPQEVPMEVSVRDEGDEEVELADVWHRRGRAQEGEPSKRLPSGSVNSQVPPSISAAFSYDDLGNMVERRPSHFDRERHGSVFERDRHGSVFERDRHGSVFERQTSEWGAAGRQTTTFADDREDSAKRRAERLMEAKADADRRRQYAANLEQNVRSRMKAWEEWDKVKAQEEEKLKTTLADLRTELAEIDQLLKATAGGATGTGMGARKIAQERAEHLRKVIPVTKELLDKRTRERKDAVPVLTAEEDATWRGIQAQEREAHSAAVAAAKESKRRQGKEAARQYGHLAQRDKRAAELKERIKQKLEFQQQVELHYSAATERWQEARKEVEAGLASLRETDPGPAKEALIEELENALRLIAFEEERGRETRRSDLALCELTADERAVQRELEEAAPAPALSLAVVTPAESCLTPEDGAASPPSMCSPAGRTDRGEADPVAMMQGFRDALGGARARAPQAGRGAGPRRGRATTITKGAQQGPGAGRRRRGETIAAAKEREPVALTPVTSGQLQSSVRVKWLRDCLAAPGGVTTPPPATLEAPGGDVVGVYLPVRSATARVGDLVSRVAAALRPDEPEENAAALCVAAAAAAASHAAVLADDFSSVSGSGLSRSRSPRSSVHGKPGSPHRSQSVKSADGRLRLSVHATQPIDGYGRRTPLCSPRAASESWPEFQQLEPGMRFVSNQSSAGGSIAAMLQTRNFARVSTPSQSVHSDLEATVRAKPPSLLALGRRPSTQTHQTGVSPLQRRVSQTPSAPALDLAAEHFAGVCGISSIAEIVTVDATVGECAEALAAADAGAAAALVVLHCAALAADSPVSPRSLVQALWTGGGFAAALTGDSVDMQALRSLPPDPFADWVCAAVERERMHQVGEPRRSPTAALRSPASSAGRSRRSSRSPAPATDYREREDGWRHLGGPVTGPELGVGPDWEDIKGRGAAAVHEVARYFWRRVWPETYLQTPRGHPKRPRGLVTRLRLEVEGDQHSSQGLRWGLTTARSQPRRKPPPEPPPRVQHQAAKRLGAQFRDFEGHQVTLRLRLGALIHRWRGIGKEYRQLHLKWKSWNSSGALSGTVCGTCYGSLKLELHAGTAVVTAQVCPRGEKIPPTVGKGRLRLGDSQHHVVQCNVRMAADGWAVLTAIAELARTAHIHLAGAWPPPDANALNHPAVQICTPPRAKRASGEFFLRTSSRMSSRQMTHDSVTSESARGPAGKQPPSPAVQVLFSPTAKLKRKRPPVQLIDDRQGPQQVVG
eukprot:TRINITY_DN21471_c0_g2_i1.p1 TRINITY_DN21471_c0_g2~~TRINITY_DN21471_c0_g2_i1.p1  ORF type:complete len:1633 (+),score=329.35 TRINITY_DN21471_c0_g2_i1:101-4999(+)